VWPPSPHISHANHAGASF
jgi:hypothetical protein